MSDQDFESGLDEQLDLAAEGLTPPDELDLAQDREDRQAGESHQEDTAAQKEDTEDLSGEQFVYTLPDGTEFQGTVDEIVAKAAEAAKPAEAPPDLHAKIQELEAKLEQATAKPQEKGQEEDAGIPAVDWTKTGDFLAECLGVNVEEMTSQERQALGRVGPAVQEAVNREFLTSPAIRHTLDKYINFQVEQLLTNKETTTKKESAFREFVGDEPDKAAVDDFMKANPHLESRKEAILGMKMATLKQELADLKSGKVKEVEEAGKKGKQDGEKETIKNLKAKGQLRRVAAQQGGKSDKPGGLPPPKTENERLSRWTQKVRELDAAR